MTHLNASFIADDCEPRRERRDQAERIWTRADLLGNEDRTLLRLHLDHGSSYRQIARLMGVRPTTVARRIRRITKRLLDDTYPACRRHRTCFSPLQLAVIRDFFARGMTMRNISRKHHITYYRVRSTVLAAQQFAASIRQRERGVRPHLAQEKESRQ
jgi:transposase-like protein